MPHHFHALRSNFRYLIPLAVSATLAVLAGCAVGPERQRLVSKPNMQFSRSAVFSYSSRTMPQILPGLATTGGAQASTCTLCK